MDKIIQAILCALSFFAPIHYALFGIVIFVIIDFLTGVWKAFRLNERIQSRRMRDTIGKFIGYFILLLIGQIFDSWFIIPLMGDNLFLQFFVFCIASTEFYSILENVSIILGIPNLKDKIIEFLAQNKKKD